jgi:hypothetical protein
MTWSTWARAASSPLAGLDDEIRLLPLDRIRRLPRQYGLKFGFIMPSRAKTRSRCTCGGALTTTTAST